MSIFGSIQFASITFLAGLAVGAGGLWIAQNGWGKVLARRKRLEQQAQAIYDQITGQVKVAVDATLPGALHNALAPVNAALAELKGIGPRVTALEAAVKPAAAAVAADLAKAV